MIALAVVILGGLGAAWALSSSPKSGPLPTIAIQSPVATTLSWFSAVNDQNLPLALAHFAPGARGQMQWSSWGPPFTHLHCSLESKATTNAQVYCTFADINDPDTGMSNVSNWAVYLQRESSGRWLINSYGQG